MEDGRFRFAGEGAGDGGLVGALRFRGEDELEEGVVVIMVSFVALDIGLRRGRVGGGFGVRFIVAFDFPG